MIRFALKSLAGRKLRTTLTALAIVLGVAMMSGAYVLTDTIDKAFDAIFVDSYAGTDAVVTGKDPGFSFEGESAEAPPIPEETLERVRAVDGVEVATGSVQDFQTKMLRPTARRSTRAGRRRSPSGIETGPEYDRFNPLNLVEGRWPAAGARSRSTRASRTTRASSSATGSGSPRSGRRRSSGSSGIAKYGELSSIGGATFAIFDVPTAQKLLDKEGELDAVQVAAAEGTTPEQLTQRIRSELGERLHRANGRRAGGRGSRARSPPSRRSSATSCSRSRASRSSSARSSSSTRSRSRSRSGCASSPRCARSARRGGRCCGR